MTLQLSWVLFLPAVINAEWNYNIKDHEGPWNWGYKCVTGKRQSPINIDAADVTIDCSTSPLKFGDYATELTNYTEKNNGHTIGIAFGEPHGNYRISGGGLEGPYSLVQFHMHWGTAEWKGSEHTLSHLSYPLEIHFVHVREDLLDKDYLSYDDGLAVVGVMVEVVEGADTKSTRAFDSLLEGVAEAKMANQTAKGRPINLNNLLPDDTHKFYRYLGSLTTPKCDEAVIWSVLANAITMTPSQLAAFRQVQDSHGLAMYNYRPTQPLNGRVVTLHTNRCPRVLDVRQNSALRPHFQFHLTAAIALMALALKL